MRIYITGGTGFIGTRVVAQLKDKHTVKLLSGRLSDLLTIEKELRQFKPEVVIHLAWEGIPNVGSVMSAQNLKESLSFFELVSKLKISKLIGVGSAWEYESEAELIKSKHGPFVAAKKTLRVFGETLLQEYGGVFVWAIPFFVYGKGKKNVSLIPSLLAQAEEGQTPTPKNSDAWHDFVYVDDVARAIVLLATKKVASGFYDIGSGRLVRTGEIARAVAKIFSLPPITLSNTAKNGHKANIRRLRKATGWEPRWSLTKALKAMRQENEQRS